MHQRHYRKKMAKEPQRGEESKNLHNPGYVRVPRAGKNQNRVPRMGRHSERLLLMLVLVVCTALYMLCLCFAIAKTK